MRKVKVILKIHQQILRKEEDRRGQRELKNYHSGMRNRSRAKILNSSLTNFHHGALINRSSNSNSRRKLNYLSLRSHNRRKIFCHCQKMKLINRKTQLQQTLMSYLPPFLLQRSCSHLPVKDNFPRNKIKLQHKSITS